MGSRLNQGSRFNQGSLPFFQQFWDSWHSRIAGAAPVGTTYFKEVSVIFSCMQLQGLGTYALPGALGRGRDRDKDRRRGRKGCARR